MGALRAAALIFLAGLCLMPTFSQADQNEQKAEVEPCLWGFVPNSAPLLSPREGAVGLVYDNLFHLIGGSQGGTPLASHETYDPVAGIWTVLNTMPAPLYGHCGTVMDGIIYSVGAYMDPDYLASVFAYDADAGQWEQLGDFRYGVAFGACVEHNGLLYMIGGDTDFGPTGRTFVYNMSEDDWDELAAMPAPAFRHAAIPYGDYIYVAGGDSSDVLYRYDPAFDTWDTLSALPNVSSATPLIAPQYAESEYFWAFGLYDDASIDSAVYEYTPVDDLWNERTDFGQVPFPALYSAAANFHDSLIFLAGGSGSGGSVLRVFNHCAPYVGRISPSVINNYQSSNVDILGLNFDTGANSKFILIGEEDIQLSDVSVTETGRAVAEIPSFLEPGLYGIEVTNSSYDEAFATKAFDDVLEVDAPLPLVSSISPDQTQVDTLVAVSVTISGRHFFGTPSVTITKGGAAKTIATGVSVKDSRTINCTLKVSTLPSGFYDVIVVTENGTGRLIDGFKISEADHGDREGHKHEGGGTADVVTMEEMCCGVWDCYTDCRIICDLTDDDDDDDDDDWEDDDEDDDDEDDDDWDDDYYDDEDDDDEDDDDEDDDDEDDDDDEGGCCGGCGCSEGEDPDPVPEPVAEG